MDIFGSQWERVGLDSLNMALWTGQFERVLDEKKRFLLPKVFREMIAENHVYFTPGTQHCLELHTEESLIDQVQQLRKNSTNEKARRHFTRLYYSQSQSCPIDGQGRIRLPQSLSLWADLDREITIVGTGFWLEVWNSNRWNEFLTSYQDDFDQLCEQAFDGQKFVLKETSDNAIYGESSEDLMNSNSPRMPQPK